LLRDELDAIGTQNRNREKFSKSELRPQSIGESFRGICCQALSIDLVIRAALCERRFHIARKVLDIQGCEPEIDIERAFKIVDIILENLGVLFHDRVDTFTQPVVEPARYESADEEGNDHCRDQCRKPEKQHEPFGETPLAFSPSTNLNGDVFPRHDDSQDGDHDKIQAEQPRRRASCGIIRIDARNRDKCSEHSDERSNYEEPLEEGPARLRCLLAQCIRHSTLLCSGHPGPVAFAPHIGVGSATVVH